MIKEKYFSVYSDFKTSILSKLFFIFSGFLIIFVLVLKIINYFFYKITDGIIGYFVFLSNSSFIDISLAMIILFAGLGGITLFFHHEFKKLSSIADEIEQMNQEKN